MSSEGTGCRENNLRSKVLGVREQSAQQVLDRRHRRVGCKVAMVKPWAGAGQQRAAHCLVLAEESSYVYRTLSVKVGASSRSVVCYPRTKLYIKSPPSD